MTNLNKIPQVVQVYFTGNVIIIQMTCWWITSCLKYNIEVEIYYISHSSYYYKTYIEVLFSKAISAALYIVLFLGIKIFAMTLFSRFSVASTWELCEVCLKFIFICYFRSSWKVGNCHEINSKALINTNFRFQFYSRAE